MGTAEILRTIQERLADVAHVKRVFGEPITAGNKTVIPVARIMYGFGAGSGRGGGSSEAPMGSGDGGGGGARAWPVGALEITPERTRFVSCRWDTKLVGAAIAGVTVGYWMGRRRTSRRG